ncbi:MAG: DUF2182 domain-containing protein [Myxococcales bacterium]|nr:DUF2182 domain-containing protein [Myxococcales bacterium]
MRAALRRGTLTSFTMASFRRSVIWGEHAAILAVVTALTVASWAYILWMTSDLIEHTGGFAGPVMSCCGVDLTRTFVMWVVMMIGMMLPSAAPMILAFASIRRERAPRGAALACGLFLAGYLLVWTAYSAIAAGGQWALFDAGMLDPATQRIAPLAGAFVLVAAGLFQLTPAKFACLSRCREPRSNVRRSWRGGPLGPLTMGLRHGLCCAGACSLLMVVLFAVGVMNLPWVLVLTVFVFAEKVLPWRRTVVWVGACACLLFGVATFVQSITLPN